MSGNTGTDDVMAAVGVAVEQGRAGDPAGAKRDLERLWEAVGEDGDALHRCSIAHYLDALPDDAYGSMIRAGIERNRDLLRPS